MYDLIVIGGGPAGVTAALRARELGASVALIERDHSLGGTGTNDGCVPTRVLARAARLMDNADQYESYGMTLARPELDFRRLLARTQAIMYEMHEKKQNLAHPPSVGRIAEELEQHVEEVLGHRVAGGVAPGADVGLVQLVHEHEARRQALDHGQGARPGCARTGRRCRRGCSAC